MTFEEAYFAADDQPRDSGGKFAHKGESHTEESLAGLGYRHAGNNNYTKQHTTGGGYHTARYNPDDKKISSDRHVHATGVTMTHDEALKHDSSATPPPDTKKSPFSWVKKQKGISHKRTTGFSAESPMNELEESYVRLNGGRVASSTFAAEIMPQKDDELGKMPKAPPPPRMPSETHGERTDRLHGEGRYKHEVKKATTPLAPPRPQAAPTPAAPAPGAAPVAPVPQAPAPALVPVGGGVQPIAPPMVAPALPNPAAAQQPVPQQPTPQQTPTPPPSGGAVCPHCQRPLDTMQQASPDQKGTAPDGFAVEHGDDGRFKGGGGVMPTSGGTNANNAHQPAGGKGSTPVSGIVEGNWPGKKK